MIKQIKLWYWKFVVSSLKDELEEIRFWMPALKGANKLEALKEHKRAIKDLIKAQRQVIKLSKEAL